MTPETKLSPNNDIKNKTMRPYTIIISAWGTEGGRGQRLCYGYWLLLLCYVMVHVTICNDVRSYVATVSKIKR